MPVIDSLSPYERIVLSLLWRIVRNTCPLLPDNLKTTGESPEELRESLYASTPADDPKDAPLTILKKPTKRKKREAAK